MDGTIIEIFDRVIGETKCLGVRACQRKSTQKKNTTMVRMMTMMNIQQIMLKAFDLQIDVH